ncbi:MAG: TonB-dependent receptor [Dysgonamonadaceae bacterium]|jgi:TonB-linked SusC/RagA family outer membrane protein|nr:TonB-dependent receptor [Dysgonamonadaceae bacterium]
MMKLYYQNFKKRFKCKIFLLLLFGFASFAFARAQNVVTGTVTDHNNDPLVGVSVAVKNTSQGTMTDINGRYSITVNSTDAVLVFSYLGCTPQELRVGSQTVIDVTLTEDVTSLDEVVVVGYGVQRKRDLTGAVSSVKMGDAPVGTFSTASHALAGKAAGLRVTQATAQPGAGATFRIRGETSINAGNEPLIIIDGFPVSRSSSPGSGNRYEAGSQDNALEMINPADIESIEVLKDASATAIYGSRAGHGVIIVTTKRGKEGKINVTYSGNAAVQTIAKNYDMLDASQWMTVNNMYYQEQWRRTYGQGIYAGYVTPPATSKTFDEWMTGLAPAHYYTQQEIASAKTTDWLKEVTQTGFQQSHNVSLNGGSEKNKYLASVNYFDQKGVMKNSDMNRITLNLNDDYTISKYVKAGISLNISRNKYDNVPLGTLMNEGVGIIGSALRFDPYLPVRENGKYSESRLYPQIPNPVSLLELTDITTKDRVLSSGYLSVEPVAGLTLKTTLGFDRRSVKRQQYLPSTTLHGRAANGTATQNYSDSEDYLFNLTANYMKTIDKHSFTVLAGYEYQKFNGSSFNASVSNFPIDGFLFNNMGSGTLNKSIDSSGSSSALASVFGRVNYSFADKYLFTATIRTDGASNFNPDYRWGAFPSVSAGWRFVEESFMESVKPVLSNGKLRAGWGQTGNSSVGNRTLDYFGSAGNYAFGDTGYKGIAVTELGNKSITWETTTEWNIGLDLGFLNNRINLSAEYYDRVISDLLVTSKALPMYYELTSIAGNIGKTQGQGFEVTLNTVNVKNRDFVWASDLTFYTYTDRWKERSPTWVPYAYQSVNDPIRALFYYKSDGLLKAGEQRPAWQPALLPGQVKLKNLHDEEGNPNVIDQHDRILIGSSDPDFMFGFNNTLRWKNFDLNIYLYGEVGRWRVASYYDDFIPYATKPFSTANGAGMLNLSTNALNSWTMDNQNTDVPSMFQASYDNGDYFMRKISFLRCRNITLGYTVPGLKKYVNNIRVNLSVNNPFVVSNWNGLDPETDYNSSSTMTENNASYSYPNVRTFSLGLDISF